MALRLAYLSCRGSTARAGVDRGCAQQGAAASPAGHASSEPAAGWQRRQRQRWRVVHVHSAGQVWQGRHLHEGASGELEPLGQRLLDFQLVILAEEVPPTSVRALLHLALPPPQCPPPAASPYVSQVQVVDLFARLAVRANDDLHFRPLPGSSPGGELLVEVSTIRGTAQQQQQPAEPEAMGVGSAVAAGSGSSLLAAGAGGSGSADDRHRRKRSAPSRDDAGGLGLAWAPAPAPAKACANCNIKETCAWRRHPHDRNVVLCNACRSYLDRTGVMSTPEQRRPNYRRRAGRQPQPGSVVAEQPEEEVAAAEPDAKRQRVEEEAQPPAHPTPGQQEQHRSEQLVAPVPTGPPAAPQTGTMAAPSSTPAACGTVAACAAGLEPLPAGTRWDIVHERLDVLLADCGVEEMEAQVGWCWTAGEPKNGASRWEWWDEQSGEGNKAVHS